MAQVDGDGDSDSDSDSEDARPTRPGATVRRATPPDDDDAPTTALPPAPDPVTPVVAPVVAPVKAAPSEPVPAADPTTVIIRHRRRPGLWLPLVVFIALLVAAAAVGRFVVPKPAPDPGSAPIGAGGASPDPTSGRPGSALPPLPTPPTRPADALADWAGRVAAAIGVPVVAIQAYGYAQLAMEEADPSCKVGWTTLAAVGEVESFHGQAGGAVLGKNGRSDPVIIGPLLDGQGGRALVRDTDAGAFDGDTSYDRTMGPVRLTPQQWRVHASDADGDSVQDPYDIDDASLALARLLCSASDDLSQLPGWNAALRRYHAGDAYARSVFQAADGYGQRTSSIG